MNIEMRHPSKSGLDLNNKSIAVAYIDSGNSQDSIFNHSVAEGFARQLESDYFGGRKVVDIYKMPKNDSGVYSSKDTLINLVMVSGDDIVFLFDTPVFGDISVASPVRIQGSVESPDSAYISECSVPFVTRLYVYDSMNKTDTVLSYSGSNVMRPEVYNNGKTPVDSLKSVMWKFASSPAEAVGGKAATAFLSTWKSEKYSIIYYDNFDETWTDAAEYAYDYRWEDAINQWLKLAGLNNVQQRSCAEYNLSLGCYMLGHYNLALKWLDRSDKDFPISVSSELRSRITERMKR
jgi:hypothetical protein